MTGPSGRLSGRHVDFGKALVIAGHMSNQARKDKRLLFFGLALPLLIIIMFGALIGDSATKVPLGVVVQDTGAHGRALVEGLRASPNVKVRTYADLRAVRREVRRGRMTAGLVIPAAYEDGGALTLVTQRGRIETGVLRAAVEEVSARDGRPPEGPKVESTILGNRGHVTRTPTPFAYTSASNLVLFTFVNTLAVGGTLAGVRREGLLRRMLATPTSATTVALGEGIGRFFVSLGQAIALLAVGTFIFGVRWGDPLALAPIVLLYVAVSTAAGLIFGTVLSSEEQSVPLAAPIGIALAMLGGCFWSLEVVPGWLRAVGHLTPHAWAMDAIVVLLYGAKGVGAVAPSIVALAVFAVVFMWIAARNLRRVVVDA
ncbi:MAG: linearmycin/streptolysin transport system permease protein [Actinomycetota bacterium]|jgi:ABC-2 type transport system permease protein